MRIHAPTDYLLLGKEQEAVTCMYAIFSKVLVTFTLIDITFFADHRGPASINNDMRPKRSMHCHAAPYSFLQYCDGIPVSQIHPRRLQLRKKQKSRVAQSKNERENA